MDIVQVKEKEQREGSDYKQLNFCKLFENQAQKNPKAIAVIFCDKSLSYEELDILSSNLAKLLKIKGVNAGSVVALGLYNGFNFLVGMLGIFKAGGIYLPIDPNYPANRIEAMLEDANPHSFITESSLQDNFAKWHDKILLMDRLPDLEFDIQLEPVCPKEPAYIIYTSGSTGKPKGIVIDHIGLTHAVLAYQNLHPVKYVSLMAGSISFDPSLLIVSHTLSLGGTICLPQNHDGIDPKQPDEYIQLIEKHSINFILCTPSLYSMMLNRSSKLSSLTCVDLCAEDIPDSLLKNHARVASNAFLYNVYGPSEYAMGATAAEIYNPYTKEFSEITIGKAFSNNNNVYILDKNFHDVSIGEKGEIFIGGPGLAKGYLHLETLTEKKFLFVSLTKQRYVRLYRTGDLGCLLPDGNIKFLGRDDHQVKILGHRIELEEIEKVVCSYSEVNKAVVNVRVDKRGLKQLVAYFSIDSSTQICEKLKVFLQERLPSYMIPSEFFQIKEWPHNQNGKIDRKALANYS